MSSICRKLLVQVLRTQLVFRNEIDPTCNDYLQHVCTAETEVIVQVCQLQVVLDVQEQLFSPGEHCGPIKPNSSKLNMVSTDCSQTTATVMDIDQGSTN